MTAGKKLVERDKVAIAFAHLFTLNGDHIIVHPVAYQLVPHSGFGLGYLALVVREYEIHPSPVYVK